MKIPKHVLSVTFVASTAAVLFSQTKPSFEVASIKPGTPIDIRSGIHVQSGGRFNTENITVRTLIGFAYNLRNDEVIGGPNWLDSATFTIEAKASDASSAGRESDAQIKLMVQSLLADRFRLVVHSETKQQPVYELILANNGHKLRPADTNEHDSQLTVHRGHLTAKNVPVSQFVHSLSLQFGRTVIDRTGLNGRYDFDVTYTPETRDGVFGQLVTPESAALADQEQTSIFTALQEQLGLKLESTRGSARVLIIDSVLKLSEN